MWESLRLYVPAVFRRWWLTVTGILAGIVWLLSLFVTIPTIPNWVWLALFAVFFTAAQFLAFHQVRLERDGGEQPGLSLLAPASWWHIGGYAYDPERNALLATPEAFVGDPECKMTFVTDIEMAAHGGSKGAAFYGLTWTMNNLPDQAQFEEPTVVMPIALQGGEIAPLRPRLNINVDRVRLSRLTTIWEELPDDPTLVARYHIRGQSKVRETQLHFPRARIATAIAEFRKEKGLLSEVAQTASASR